MSIYRLLVSFVAGSLVVLTMLLAGLKLFNDRQVASSSNELPDFESFEVEYLTPQEAARLLGEDLAKDSEESEPDDD